MPSRPSRARPRRRATSRLQRAGGQPGSWLKVSSRDRVFRMTAEQVLNHLLPALAFGEAKGLTVTVDHYDTPYWERALYGLPDAG